MRLIFEPDSLRQNELGTVTATIYWDFGGHHYPAYMHRDFALVVVDWWMQAVGALYNDGQEHSAVVRFMDTSAVLHLKMEADSEQVTCFDELRRPSLQEQVELSELKAQLEKIVTQILYACQQRQIVGPNLEALQKWQPCFSLRD